MEDTKRKSHRTLRCADVVSWRAATKIEVLAFLKSRGSSAKGKRKRKNSSVLAVRQHLRPVDVYCYLKARFGEPNSLQTFLREDSSDNWIHWDFNIKAGDEDIYVCGTSREVHFFLSEHMTDEDWRELILAIKADYKRVAAAKAAVLKSLERWVIFPNKFSAIANLCAELHGTIEENIGGYQIYKTPSYNKKRESLQQAEVGRRLSERSTKLYKSCIQLSLLTPVLAEAFLNVAVLMLCKAEVRNNKRQYDAFVRSNIDTKIFDLFYKCEGFARPIDPQAEPYKAFKRMMDKRNQAIHGNCDPEAEQIEQVYFEGKRPLFTEPGDHIGKFFEALERLHHPETVLKDYEDTHTFLCEIAACLKPDVVESFWRIMQDPYPGYDLDRKRVGCLFAERITVAHAQGVRYDDELAVAWQ